MRFHQNNVFKDSIAVWKRFIRTDFMTLGWIDVDAEMIQPNRFWLMTENKNRRKKIGDKGDQFQTQIMEERCVASKIPFLGTITVNTNEQSPYVFLQQSVVENIITNVEEPEDYYGLPIDIVIFKWLEINNLFESDDEKSNFIKQYNNNVLNFVNSEAFKQLQTPTFNHSITKMVVDWGINNKMWSQKEVENGRINNLINIIQNQINDFCSNDLNRGFLLDEYVKKATFEQGSNPNDYIYFLDSHGKPVKKTITEVKNIKR